MKYLVLAVALAAGTLSTPALAGGSVEAEQILVSSGANPVSYRGQNVFVCARDGSGWSRFGVNQWGDWQLLTFLPPSAEHNNHCPTADRGKMRIGSVTGPYLRVQQVRRLPSQPVRNPRLAYEDVYVCNHGRVNTVSYAANGSVSRFDFNAETGDGNERCVATN